MSVKIQAELQSELRCAYCRERIDGRVYRCSGCHTSLHAACQDQLAVCPALGCAHVFSDAKVLVASGRALAPWAVFVVATVVGLAGLVAARRPAERPEPTATPAKPTRSLPLDLLGVGTILARDADAGRRRAAAAALAQDLDRHGFAARRRDVLQLRGLLLDALRDADPVVRLHVARSLALYGRWLWVPAEQRPALLAACADADPRVRRVAVACLRAAIPPRKQPSDDVAGALVARLDDDDLQVRAAAIEVIANVSDEAISKPQTARAHPALLAALPALVKSAQHPRLHSGALRALAQLAQHAATDDVRAYATPQRGAQVARVRAHQARLLPLAIAALDDARTRADGVELLARLSVPAEHTKAVADALARAWASNPDLRSRIVGVLGGLGPSGLPLLQRAFVPATPEPLRRNLASALARTKTAAGRQTLLAALADADLRSAAAAGLPGLQGLTGADVAALRKGFAGADVATRQAIVLTVARIDAPEAIPFLARAASDPYRRVCVDALTALAKFPPALLEPALGALQAALADRFADVRSRAAGLLHSVRTALPPLPLADLLADLRSDDVGRRRRAAWRIGPGPEVGATLLKVLDRRDPITACLILRAFPRVGAGGDVVPALGGFLGPKTPPALQDAALTALTGLKQHALDALPLVIGVLERSDDASLLRRACTLVGTLGPPAKAASPALEALRKHPDEGVVATAEWALKRLTP